MSGCRREALAAKGGVMGLSFYTVFIDRDRPTMNRLCDHFLHALDVIGPDHVGIGTDFDGLPEHLEPIPPDVSHLPDVFDALRGKGVDEGTITKIAGENFLRVLA